MNKVNWKSRILSLTQSLKKDEIFHAFQDTHNGITAVKSAVENIKLNSHEPIGNVDSLNKTFKVSHEPAFLVVGGVVKVHGTDFVYNNGYVIFNVAPTAGATIRAFYV